MGQGQARTACWRGRVPCEAAEHIKTLAVAPVQVQAEDGREDKHHGCEVAADHYGRLGVEGGQRAWVKPAPGSTPALSPGPAGRPHLQGEGPQGRDGHEGGHEEGHHVVDGRERDAGARALQTLTGALLPGQGSVRGRLGHLGGRAGRGTAQQPTLTGSRESSHAVLSTQRELHHRAAQPPPGHKC